MKNNCILKTDLVNTSGKNGSRFFINVYKRFFLFHTAIER